VYEVISMEAMITPAVALCNAGFENDARSAARSRGWPGLRIVPETVPSECDDKEQIEAGINAVMDDIVAALTRPLTAEEQSPKPQEIEQPQRMVFKGNIGEVNQFYYQRGWTDGLPIIPPTEEAVAEMLAGTDLPADHVVGKIIPRLGKATVEKIAINAVMAGALPTYMPLLIAGVQAIMEPDSFFSSYGVSTGSFIPCWIVNGPIRNDLNINSGSGVLSPGDMANATIGRAMGLIIKNIGGIRKGIEDMGTTGHPGKYSMVIAENEEESPWEPLHVEQGFKRADSTISITFSAFFWAVGYYSSDDKGVLRSAVYNIPPATVGSLTLMLPPHQAKFLADNGWTKQKVGAFIAHNARSPLYHFPHYHGMYPDLPEPGERGLLMSPDDSISVFSTNDSVKIVVAGGKGHQFGFIRGGKSHVTKKVELPSDWDKLVSKYKNIVPAYVRY
jgi:hypothetical protein